MAVAKHAETHRRFLIRLVERRCEQEPSWRGQVPLSVLEETKLVMHFDLRDGTRIAVAGKMAGETRTWSFEELAVMVNSGATAEDLITANRLKEAWDMEYDGIDRPPRRRRAAQS
jgi:hypothetical protein